MSVLIETLMCWLLMKQKSIRWYDSLGNVFFILIVVNTFVSKDTHHSIFDKEIQNM